MKNTILKVTLVLAIAFTYSCGGKTKHKQDDTQVEKKEKTDELHQSEQNGLVLNNGKPWLANSETTVGVENMQEIMKNFTEKSSVKAYETLSKRLKSEFSMVFEKCTMKGEAHNQFT